MYVYVCVCMCMCVCVCVCVWCLVFFVTWLFFFGHTRSIGLYVETDSASRLQEGVDVERTIGDLVGDRTVITSG